MSLLLNATCEHLLFVIFDRSNRFYRERESARVKGFGRNRLA